MKKTKFCWWNLVPSLKWNTQNHSTLILHISAVSNAQTNGARCLELISNLTCEKTYVVAPVASSVAKVTISYITQVEKRQLEKRRLCTTVPWTVVVFVVQNMCGPRGPPQRITKLCANLSNEVNARSCTKREWWVWVFFFQLRWRNKREKERWKGGGTRWST